MNPNGAIIDVTPIEHSRERRPVSGNGISYSSSDSFSAKRQSSPWSYSADGAGKSRKSSSAADPDAPSSPSSAFDFAAYRVSESTNGGWSSANPGFTRAKTPRSVINGIVQIVAGMGLVLIGIPMLILPGPGLLAIGGGLALAANGARKAFG